MSSGKAPIAYVEIEHGVVSFGEVRGDWAPDFAHTVELRLKFTEHGESDGNIYAAPIERDVRVYLTDAQLGELTKQLSAYLTSDSKLETDAMNARWREFQKMEPATKLASPIAANPASGGTMSEVTEVHE